MLSERLRTILSKRQMTMEELSTLSGVPLETIRNLFYHKAENPRLNTVLALSKALNVSVESMVLDTPRESEDLLLERYHKCSSHGKFLVDLVASVEAEMTVYMKKQPSVHRIPCFLPVHTQRDGSPYSTCSFRQINSPCADAFAAIQVPNNDFAPAYCLDDILLLANRFPQEGEHALFLHEGHIYFRKFHTTHDGGYALFAVCSRGITLRFKRMDTCRLLGTCIGILREEEPA